MKFIHKITKRLHKLVSKHNFKTSFTKRKKLTFAAIIVVLIVISVTTTLLNIDKQAQNQISIASDSTQSQSNIQSLPDAKVPTLSDSEKTEAKKTDTGGEPGAVENTIVLGTMPSTYVTPDFHIRTPLSMTVGTGKSVGPFTAFTSDGSSVHWSTPDESGTMHGVSGHTMEPMPYLAKKMEYYISAEDYVKPGTYYLYITARRDQNPPMMSSIMLTVTVTPTPTFTVTIDGDNYIANIDNGNSVKIPYHLNRIYGYSNLVNVGAYVNYAIGSDSIEASVVQTSASQGYILFNAPYISGTQKFTVTIEATNSYDIQSIDTASVTIQN